MRFGHIGDPDRKEVKPEEIPHFDEVQLRYLRKVLPETAVPATAESIEQAVKIVAGVALLAGRAEVYAHIEALIESQPKGPR